jgi:DNA-binding transcriptional ArsR family regulator
VKVSNRDLPALLDRKLVRAVREAIPSAEVIHEAVEVFKALANPIRVRLLHALAHEELSVGDLAHAFDLPLSTVSHQLAVFRRLRLVSSRDQGRLTFYRASDEFIGHLVHDALAHVATRLPSARHHHRHRVPSPKRH